MKTYIYKLALLIFILANNFQLSAQTPSVTTNIPLIIKPYIYKAASDTAYTYDAKVTFIGIVNANGLERSVYFEYGPTTSYGYTVAASPSIVAGTDNITVGATTVIYHCEADYHCRLCVVSGGVTYYGSDIKFAPEVDPTVNLLFTANPSDDPNMTSFTIANNNYFPVSLTCTDGTITDTLNIAPHATQDFACNKHRMVSFYYNYTNSDGSTVYPFLFSQMPTNDQTTQETPSAQTNITITAFGCSAGKDTVWYNIANANDGDANFVVVTGGGALQVTFIVGKNSNETIATPYDDATFYFNNINISEFFKPLVKTTYAWSWYFYNTTYIYGFHNLSPLFCYAYPQKVYLDASDNIVTSKIITSYPQVDAIPNQSWINGDSTESIYPFNTPLSMSIGANTTGQTRTATIGVIAPLCYVTVVQSGLTVPKQHLMMRLRADQAITSSGDSVSVWGDMSGNGNNATQSTGAFQPIVVAGEINNMPALRFNGTNSYLSLPTSTALGIQNHDYEMFIVAQSGNTAQPEFLIAGGSYEQFEYRLNGSSGARFIPISSTYIDEGTTGSYADGKPHIFSARASETGGAVRVDGVDGNTSTSNILSSNAGNLRLGVRSDGTYYFNGDIAEVLVYDTVLTSAQRDSVEHYLVDRYGISSGALPVELTSFTAALTNSKSSPTSSVSVLLKWQTATEVNNYGFEVQRTIQNSNSIIQNWEKVGFVNGSGNSNSPKSYTFTDNSPLSGSASYRLKQIDNNGGYKYSPELSVSLLPTKYSLYQNFPNPFNPTTTIKYDLPKDSKVMLEIYNITGQKVALLVNQDQKAGSYNMDFNGSNLASGVYFYRLQAGSFVQIKKLLLLK